MPMDNVTLENTQQSISSRDAKSVASVMVNGKWVNLSDTLEQANVKSDVGTVAKQVAAQQEVVSNAVSTADSAVAYANDAIEKSKVNSQAIDDINLAVSDVASAAAVARSDGLRAWNAAQSNVNLIDLNYASASAAISSARTEAIAAADEAKSSASAAQAGVVAVRSDVATVQADVTATRSDVAVAKSDIADTKTTLAQTASDLNSKISGVETSLADTTSALSDAKTALSSDVADAKKLANTAQTTADSAVAVASDAKSNATVAIQTASQASITAKNSSGQAASAVITANGAMTTASDAKSNATVAVQTASGASLTAINANSDATVAKQTASEAKVQASNAESDFAQLSIRAGQIETSVANNSGAIASVQQTANGLTTTVADIKANGGGRNLLSNSSGEFQPNSSKTDNWSVYSNSTVYMTQGQQYTVHANASSGLVWSGNHDPSKESNNVVLWLTDNTKVSRIISDANTGTRTTFTWNNPSGIYYLRVNTYKSDNSGYAENVMLEKGIVAHDWSPAPEDTDAKITANTTAIEQNKQAIELKADQTTVDKTNGTVQQLQSQLKVQADQIATKVSSSDLDARNYATQTYTQTQIKQTADSWNANLASVKDDLTQSYTNLHATVDGIQAQVYNSDGSSKITQLSDLVQNKVSSGDFTSMTTQLKNLINQRVQVGDVVSQINQEAGGNTLIQVSNGKGSFILNADNTIMTGKAWIPSAAIANLTADDITTGTLKGVKVDFRDSTGTGMIADGSTLTFDVSNTPAGYLSYNGMPVAEIPDGSGGNELAIRYGLSTAIIPDDNSGAQATFSKAAQKIAYMTGTSQGKQMLSGLEVHSNNHHWLCAVNSDATCNRFEVNDRDGLNIAWHDNTHFWISDGKAKLYQDNNDSPTATKLEIHGWAWVNGWVEAAGHSQHSALSTKTALQAIDDNEMLEMVNNTDLASFLFKTDVASGETHRHIGLIIDDVHDVAQYQAPQDFIAPNGVSRDDDNMIGALFGAVKALTKRIKTLESKVG